MAVIALIATLIIFPLIGMLLAPRSWAEAYLLGVGLCGSVLFVGGVLHVPLTWTFAALLMAGVVECGRHATALFQRRQGRRTPQLAATLVMLVPLVALFIAAAVIPLDDFDGRAFWALKAKGLAHDGAVDGPFFRGEQVNDPRNHYPILIPLDGAVILSIVRDLDDRHLRWLYLFLFVALVLYVRERIGWLVDPATGAWCAAIVAWIPQLTVAAEGGALSAYSDIAVAAFVAGAVFEMVAAESPLRFGLWLAFLVLTKSEGLPFAVILLAIGVVAFRRRIAVPALLTATATAALLVWRHRIPRGDEEDFIARLPFITENLDRVGPAIGAFIRHMLSFRQWGFFWVAVIVAAFIARRSGRLAIAVIVAMLAVYVGTYVATVWTLEDLVRTSANRLLIHFVGPATLLLALAGRKGRKGVTSGKST